MESFFDRVTTRDQPWPAGRADLHWNILLDPGETRAALFEPYRPLTHRDGLAPVAPPWYHVTVLHAAPIDEVSSKEIDELVARVTRHCAQIAPFQLTLEPPTAASVALECPGHRGAPARHLWRMTAEVNHAVLGDRHTQVLSSYNPHLSLAYCYQTTLHGPMKEWLSDHRAAPYTFTVSAISLVAQSHDGRHLTWKHLHEVPLAGRS